MKREGRKSQIRKAKKSGFFSLESARLETFPDFSIISIRDCLSSRSLLIRSHLLFLAISLLSSDQEGAMTDQNIERLLKEIQEVDKKIRQ